MILKIKGKQTPTQSSLRDGESVVVEHEPAQYSPTDKGGLFMYLRVGKKLFRSKLEEVEWRE